MAPDEHEGERLQKVLARAGLGSRRVCEDLIAEGRVTRQRRGGRCSGRRVDLEADLIEVDGAAIGVRPGLVHYLLNKPAGVVTTADDPQGRPTVARAWCPPSPGCSRSDASISTPRACCC